MVDTLIPRKPLYDPLCGDVWQLGDGGAFVVDYIDGLQIGTTFLDGARKGCNYRNAYSSWLKREKGQLLSSFEQRPLPWNCDDRGWTKDRKAKHPTGEQSVSFLKLVLSVKRLKMAPRDWDTDPPVGSQHP